MQKKNNNAPNYVGRFKIPIVLMVMFTVYCNILLICATWNFDFVVILCLKRNCQLFEYNHFKIILHYYFHMNSSLVSSYYKLTQIIVCINGIIDPITGDVMNSIAPSTIRDTY